MPKVVYLLACQRFIRDAEDGQVSLIDVLQDVNLTVPKGETVPPNTVEPKEWYIIDVLRHSDPSEVGKRFINHIEISVPDGQSAASKTPFLLTEKGYLNKIDLINIPISVEGTLSIRLWIYEEGQEKPDTPPLAIYDEINVRHTVVEK